MFKLNLRLCHYNLFPGRGGNQKWSKHWFHWYMVCYALERHGAANWRETWAGTLRKGNFDSIWRITVYNWLKVKLLYCSSIKQAFQCFLQLGDMYFSSWDIKFFATSVFRESEAVSASQISEMFKMKQVCIVKAYSWIFASVSLIKLVLQKIKQFIKKNFQIPPLQK